MINLLPPEEKRKLHNKKKERLAIVLGIVVFIFLFCLVLILLALKFYILTQTDYQKNILRQAQLEHQTSEFMGAIGNIQKYNVTLAQLSAFYKKEVYFNQVLKTITDVPRPVGLYLTNFSLDRSVNGLVKLSVSGISDTRDNLLIFKNNIEANKNIIKPNFSQESWINPKNANFSFICEISQNGK